MINYVKQNWRYVYNIAWRNKEILMYIRDNYIEYSDKSDHVLLSFIGKIRRKERRQHILINKEKSSTTIERNID